MTVQHGVVFEADFLLAACRMEEDQRKKITQEFQPTEPKTVKAEAVEYIDDEVEVLEIDYGEEEIVEDSIDDIDGDDIDNDSMEIESELTSNHKPVNKRKSSDMVDEAPPAKINAAVAECRKENNVVESKSSSVVKVSYQGCEKQTETTKSIKATPSTSNGSFGKPSTEISDNPSVTVEESLPPTSHTASKYFPDQTKSRACAETKVNQKARFSCDECEKAYSSRRGLDHHKITKHLNSLLEKRKIDMDGRKAKNASSLGSTNSTSVVSSPISIPNTLNVNKNELSEPVKVKPTDLNGVRKKIKDMNKEERKAYDRRKKEEKKEKKEKETQLSSPTNNKDSDEQKSGTQDNQHKKDYLEGFNLVQNNPKNVVVGQLRDETLPKSEDGADLKAKQSEITSKMLRLLRSSLYFATHASDYYEENDESKLELFKETKLSFLSDWKNRKLEGQSLKSGQKITTNHFLSPARIVLKTSLAVLEYLRLSGTELELLRNHSEKLGVKTQKFEKYFSEIMR